MRLANAALFVLSLPLVLADLAPRHPSHVYQVERRRPAHAERLVPVARADILGGLTGQTTPSSGTGTGTGTGTTGNTGTGTGTGTTGTDSSGDTDTSGTTGTTGTTGTGTGTGTGTTTGGDTTGDDTTPASPGAANLTDTSSSLTPKAGSSTTLNSAMSNSNSNTKSNSAVPTGSSSPTASILNGTAASVPSNSASVVSTTGSGTPTPAANSQSISQSASVSASLSVSTNAKGEVFTTTIYAAVASSSSSPSPDSSSSRASGPAISTGAIVGIAVGVGVVVFALIGLAVWRMKRRGSDEDEAIRWPELNRHGDSNAVHALPATTTGRHGFGDDGRHRLSTSSDMYGGPSGGGVAGTAPDMALNGSNFGAASSLEDYEPHAGAYDDGYAHGHGMGSGAAADQTGAYADEHEDYTSFPPPVGLQHTVSGGGYETASEEDADHYALPNPHAGGQQPQMGMVSGGPVSYGHHQ